MMQSLRAIGYSFDTALADIVDNSISARATHIDIRFRADPAYLAIIDNGQGMTQETLIAAMRHGAFGPEGMRDAADLGRYGLGLKTASLSQCRRFTVVSLAAGALSAARWDLDEVEAADDWVLEVLSAEEAAVVPHAANLMELGSGTVVLWENFDRATAGEASPAAALERLVDESRDHLALIFHRFLHPDVPGPGVQLAINSLPIAPIDPFLSGNRYTERLPEEAVQLEGQTIRIQPFILPHLSHITPAELQAVGSKDLLRQTQGFYVYRNRRLIISGTWFRLIRHDELSKLARVRIDIPNALDHLWSLDVKKSTATPPEQVRAVLKRIIDRIADRSHNVFRERRRRVRALTITHLWERVRVRGGLAYQLNRLHPAIEETLDSLPADQRLKVQQLLRLIELGLPADSIYSDMASDEVVHPDSPEVRQELLQQVTNWLSTAGDNLTIREHLLAALPALEPFSMYPRVTKSIIEELTNAN